MPGRRECDCLDNYWRAPDDEKSMACTGEYGEILSAMKLFRPQNNYDFYNNTEQLSLKSETFLLKVLVIKIFLQPFLLPLIQEEYLSVRGERNAH